MSSINTLKGNIKAIADAIRFRTNSNGKITLSQMPDKIANIGVPTAQDWAASLELNGLVGDVVLPVSNGIRPYAFYNAGYGASNNFNIIIPEGTTRVYGNAFDSCRAKSISIPSTVTQYGAEAFAHSSITSVNIASSADISNACFDGCYNLSDVVFSYGIKSISYYAFRNCSSITTLVLPYKLASVGEEAFSGCTKLNDVKFMSDDGILKIYTGAFKNCSSLTGVWFENKPQIIAANAFEGCTALKTINVPWNEGEVANAPWGAVNAKIKYRNAPISGVELDYTGEFNGTTSSVYFYRGDVNLEEEYSRIVINVTGASNDSGYNISDNASANPYFQIKSTTSGTGNTWISPSYYDGPVSIDTAFPELSFAPNIIFPCDNDGVITIEFHDATHEYTWESVIGDRTFRGRGFYLYNQHAVAMHYNHVPISVENISIVATPK